MAEKFTRGNYEHLRKSGFNPAICMECTSISVILMEIANNPVYAQAPAMYEALKEIAELAPRNKLRLPYAHQVVEIADAVLAKIEGKE